MDADVVDSHDRVLFVVSLARALVRVVLEGFGGVG